MSRPKKAVGTHLAITAIRMPPQVKVKLEALSFQTGLAQQEHIRRALDSYFDVLEREGKFDPHSRRPADAKLRGRPRVVLPAPSRRVFRRPNMSASA
jgi:hypothetical protein